MSKDKIFHELSQKIDELSLRIEGLNLAEYLEILRNPKRLLYVNFLGGLARGFGTAIGFTLLGALYYIFFNVWCFEIAYHRDFYCRYYKNCSKAAFRPLVSKGGQCLQLLKYKNQFSKIKEST